MCPFSPECQHPTPLDLDLLLPDLDLNLLFFSLFIDFSLLTTLMALPDVSTAPVTSCTPLRREEHPPYHQTSRFLSHMNCSLSSRDHPRSLVDWTIELAPRSHHQIDSNRFQLACQRVEFIEMLNDASTVRHPQVGQLHQENFVEGFSYIFNRVNISLGLSSP